jgi:hypothetical protein
MPMSSALRTRLVLTFVWLLSLMLTLGVVESYVHARTPEGKRYILPEDRDDTIPRLLKGYSAYVAAVLAFWFLKPFTRPKSSAADRGRFWIALTCTVLFNVAILFLLLECYLEPAGQRNFPADVDTAMGLMKWLSFVVAPVNAFYFGAKSSA